MVIPNIQAAHVNDEIDENPSHGKMICQIVYKGRDFMDGIFIYVVCNNVIYGR